MTKISNQYSLTNILTADLANSRLGINNVSPAYSLDVTGTARVSTSAYFATASGSVGIGTTSPSDKLSVIGSSGVDGFIFVSGGSGTTLGGLKFGNTTNTYGRLFFDNATNDVTLFQQYLSGNLIFGTNSTERMRITSGGDVLISNTDGNGKLVIGGDDNNYILRSRNTSAGGNYQFYIQHSLANVSMGNQRGTVAYNNSSDYRLKEDLKEFNGLDILSSINFYDFKWKQNQIRNYGVIAHELQEILPYVVEGKKDELFEDGSVKSQQVDITKLVPILGKAIQELSAEITIISNKIK